MQRYLWQQAGGLRHAYDTQRDIPAPERELAALCGQVVTPTVDDITGLWLDRTCWACDREIRVRLRFPADEIPPASALEEAK
ncbi:zinc finger protein [Saccharomonospora sp.]|uniref:zinc finger protein n=1 Tax=Saccharomonospora sp. TaxID=33913 RepID=UPI0026330444|nr:zinc finger protein [Saccharomonospora sp.]